MSEILEQITEPEVYQEEVTEVALSPDVIARIAQTAAEVAHRAIRSEEEAAYKRQAKRNYKRTYKALESYRIVKKMLSEQYTPDEQARFRFEFISDLMGSDYKKEPDRVILEEEMRVKKNSVAIRKIENALRLWEEDIVSQEKPEENRRLRLIRARFIDDYQMTIEEMAKTENISEKTVYKDIGIGVHRMAKYLGEMIEI